MPFIPAITGQSITPDDLAAGTNDGIIAVDVTTTGDIYLIDGGTTTWADYLANNPAAGGVITIQLAGAYTGIFEVGLDLAGTPPNLTGVPLNFDIAAGTMAPNVTLTYVGAALGAVTVNIGNNAQINSDLDLSGEDDTINIGDRAVLTQVNALDTGAGDDSIRINPRGTLDVDGSIDFGSGADTLDAAAGSGSNGGIIIADGDLSLGDGEDRVFLSNGGDVTGVTGDIYLGNGNDELISNFRSSIRAGQTIFGGQGNDSITIGRQGVIADGGIGDDVLRGQANGQTLLGGEGNDELSDTGGNSSRDLLEGGSGNDTLNAGRGNDTLEGGLDDDTLTGGNGNDIFLFASGDGSDVITDFATGTFGDGNSSNNDFLDLSAFYNSSTRTAYNNAPGSTNFASVQDMLRADLAHDGIANGIFSSGNFQTELGFASGDGIEIQGTDFSTATDAELADAFNVLCFSGDTRIDTPEGTKAAHELVKGDLVWTLDRGYQPIVWTHSRTLTADQLSLRPNLDPILIQVGALGQDMPSRDLVVSPQHRLLMHNTIVERMFGEEEVLAAAVHLLSLPGFVQFRPGGGITYVHILLENHEIIMANGALAESLFLGEETDKILDAEFEHEHIFPAKELQHANKNNGLSARVLASGRKARKLAMRLEKNQRKCVANHHIAERQTRANQPQSS